MFLCAPQRAIKKNKHLCSCKLNCKTFSIENSFFSVCLTHEFSVMETKILYVIFTDVLNGFVNRQYRGILLNLLENHHHLFQGLGIDYSGFTDMLRPFWIFLISYYEHPQDFFHHFFLYLNDICVWYNTILLF